MSIGGRRKSSVRERLDLIRRMDRVSIVPFLILGWPDDETFLQIAQEAVRFADVLGLRMPSPDGFVGDGLTLQCFQETVDRGFSLAQGLGLAHEVVESSQLQVVLECHASSLVARGTVPVRHHASLSTRLESIAATGIAGLHVVDAPPEEALPSDLLAGASRHGLDLIFACSSTTSRERMQLICKHAAGFIYCVGQNIRQGGPDRDAMLARLVSDIRRHTALPIALATGITTVAVARQVGNIADACIVGSGLLRAIHEAPHSKRVASAARFLSDIREGLDATG